MCLHACVRACMRACVLACVRECVCECVCERACVRASIYLIFLLLKCNIIFKYFLFEVRTSQNSKIMIFTDLK